MSILKEKIGIIVFIACALILAMGVIYAADEIMTMKLTFQGNQISNGGTITAYSGDTSNSIAVSLDNFVANYRQKEGGPDLSTLQIGYTWDNGTLTLASTGTKTTAISIPSTLAVGKKHLLQVEAIINDTTYGYIGNSNVMNIYVDFREAKQVTVNLRNGSNSINNGQTAELSVGAKLSINTSTNYSSTVSMIAYRWDSESLVQVSGGSTDITVPSSFESGSSHTLKVQARASDGTKSSAYTYTIKIPAEVATVVTVTLKDGTKTIANNGSAEKKVNEELSITASTNNGKAVSKLAYRWDNETLIEVTGSSTKIKVPTSFLTGSSHTLRIQAMAEDNTKSSAYSYTIKIPEEIVVAPATKVAITLLDGTKTISNGESIEKKTNDTLVAKASTDNGKTISKMAYRWDSEELKEIIASSINIKIPSTYAEKSSHTLKIQALASDGTKSDDYSYTIRIISNQIVQPTEEVNTPVEIEVDDDLIIEPWMKENKNIETLSVSLRNDTDNEDKKNKNIYSLDEEIIYYVDYKNGSSKAISDVKLELKLPLDVKIVDSSGGIVSGKKITWEIDKLEKGKSGTKVVVLKYTSLGKSSLTYKMVYPEAIIYNSSKQADVSSVINLIYKDEDTEIEEGHSPYMYGDKDAPTFRPDDNITRAEGALVLTRIFGMNTNNISVTNIYPDLDETYLEAQKAVVAASKAGLIQGYEDGTYRPNDKMTRAEFMKIIAAELELMANDKKVNGIEVKSSEDSVKIYKNPSGSKSSEHWASPYVTLLARLNMTDLTSKNKDLRLDDKITRSEVAQLVNFYLFRAPAKVSSKTKSGFDDVDRSHKLFADIIEATRSKHAYKFTENGTEIEVK